MKISRHIPKEIQKAVEKRDSFKCVWCGTKLMEKHHIREFHLGGQHTVENLITLCPNCHTIVHKGGIDPLELLTRRIEQNENYRLSGNTSFSVNPPVTFDWGGIFVKKDPGPIITWRDREILAYKIDKNNELNISCRFYDNNGKLIFWMYENYYCTTGDFLISARADMINIQSSDGKQFVHFEKKNDTELLIKYNTFIDGENLIASGSLDKGDGYAKILGVELLGSGNRLVAHSNRPLIHIV